MSLIKAHRWCSILRKKNFELRDKLKEVKAVVQKYESCQSDLLVQLILDPTLDPCTSEHFLDLFYRFGREIREAAVSCQVLDLSFLFNFSRGVFCF